MSTTQMIPSLTGVHAHVSKKFYGSSMPAELTKAVDATFRLSPAEADAAVAVRVSVVPGVDRSVDPTVFCATTALFPVGVSGISRLTGTSAVAILGYSKGTDTSERTVTGGFLQISIDQVDVHMSDDGHVADVTVSIRVTGLNQLDEKPFHIVTEVITP